MNVDLLDRIVFCSLLALAAIFAAVNAVVCWIDKKVVPFLVSFIAILFSLAASILFLFHSGNLGLVGLVFGVPILLGFGFHFVKALKSWK
jgi:hypothetical protein